MVAASGFPFRLQGGGLGLAIAFALMVLFIQDGLSYYASVQVAALFFLAGVMLHAGLAVRFTPIVLAVYVLFSALLMVTTVVAPEAISQNSPNIVLTTMGVLGYVALILAMVSLRPLHADGLLLFYRRSAAAIVVLIVALVFATDLGVIPGLTREYFILQNVNLITNYTTLDVLARDLVARKARGVQPDVDLFYGEQSFLSLVLFVSLVSHVISSRVLEGSRGVSTRLSEGHGLGGGGMPLIFSGLACMVYIQSFSSLFYAAILCSFVALNVVSRVESIRLPPAKVAVLSLLLAAMIWVAIETSPYYLHRLMTFSDSLSAQQRFGIVLDFLPQDFLLGLQSAERMPAAGIHNGIIYTVMIAGMGGIAVLAYLLERVIHMARPFGLSILSMFAVLAVFSQNGAIFSPNKLAVISLVLVPLCSAAVLYQRAIAIATANPDNRRVSA